MKKFLSLALATAMGMSGASLAMADAATVDPSTLEPYNIVWYTLGTTASAEDTVMAEINKQMTEKFNATLTMNKNNNNDHLEKLKLRDESLTLVLEDGNVVVRTASGT